MKKNANLGLAFASQCALTRQNQVKWAKIGRAWSKIDDFMRNVLFIRRALGRISTALFALVLTAGGLVTAQITIPTNGVRDERSGLHAFENATIVVSPDQTLEGATLLIRDGKIVAAGKGLAIPADAVRHDCSGQYLYPSFLDLFSQYGVANKQPYERASRQEALNSERPGAWAWNEALLPEFDAAQAFVGDDKAAESMRAAGFGAVLTHRPDGVARGTGAVVLLYGKGHEHVALVRERAAAFYSFQKGSSTQDYPGSLMGAIALLRQTYLDGRWYARQTVPRKEVNLSLEAWNNTQSLPAFFEAGDHYSALRAARVGKEFGVAYTFLGDGTEYRSLNDLKAVGSAFVLPLNFPAPYKVSDPLDANMVSYPELLHWEWAPANAALLSQAGVPIALTTKGLENPGLFREALKKAMDHGLSEKAALTALTTEPARLAGVSAELGTLEAGKRANFLRCSGPIWDKETTMLENWVGGERYGLEWADAADYRGTYSLQLGNQRYDVEIGGKLHSTDFMVKRDSAALNTEGIQDRDRLSLSFQDGDAHYRLSGWWMDGKLSGLGQDQKGTWANWTATRTAPYAPKPDTAAKKDEKRIMDPAALPRPFQAFGDTSAPVQETVLFRNATVWTNGKDGVLEGADVLIKNGQISKVGRNINAGDARVVDATGKHLTAGIVDEHSHIAISRGVNEGTQASSAEVRIGDVIDPSDIDIYRQLSGGVVAAQLLHGSANPIGGQSALIKLRWGASAEQMKIEGADGFIKFALGENVKQSNWGDQNTIRFPQSRMGVEQVFVDHFTRAREYGRRKAAGDPTLRPDLDLEALLEILEKKRFITCHSYVQSEITMLIKVAEQFGFRINTFTHILEGYKVADKMKAHGVGASTFSDWWAYKYEVIDAIPHNAALLHKMGVVTAINSDDAEMGRRLNQEAAKAVKYGGVSEEDALKMVTLNPAILLHLDNRMGTVEAGKEASIVLWTDHPLSVYARAEQTWIDGRLYFSLEKDAEARKTLAAERNRIMLRMLDKAAEGGPTREPKAEHEHNYHCDDVEDEGNEGTF